MEVRKSKRQPRAPTGFQRDEPSTVAVVGEGDGGSGTRREKGREEKRGGRTLGGGLLLLLLLGEEGGQFVGRGDEELSQAEHFLLRVFVLVALDARLFLVFISLLLCVGGLLL